MPTRPRALLALLTTCLMAAFVALGPAAPALARDKYEGHKDDSNSAGLSGVRPGTQAPPANTGSPSGGSGGGGGGNYSGDPTPPIFNAPEGGPGTGACNADRYPGGYSDTLAVPAPCAPVQQCGRYLGSTFVTEACPADPADPAAPVVPVITTEMVTEAARVVAPVNPPHVEPGNRSYVNIPNNYWADAPTVNTSITLLGQQIPLRWTPTGTTWSFGDGATATGNGVEGADLGEAGALEHSYSRQGSYDITTTTNYDLTFVLPGAGTQTIQLESPPSPPVTLPVSEIQTRVSYAR